MKASSARSTMFWWVAVFSLWLAAVAPAASPFRDFSDAANPNGVWRYGYTTTLGGALIPYTTPLIEADKINGWSYDIGSGDPLILHNASNAEYNNATFTLEPGEITLHPGPDGEYSVLRFVAPAADTYRMTGSFYGRDHEGTTTDVHLLVDGKSVFDGAVNGYGPGTGPSFDQTVTLAAGDTLDFAVGYGSNETYYDDMTALVATVSPTDAAQPTVAITSPPSGLTLAPGEAVHFALSVDDPSDVLDSVQVSVNNNPVATTSGPFPYVLDTTVPGAPGTYTVTAAVTDSLGRVSQSNAVTLTVVAASTSPPSAALLTPVNGLELKAGATLTLTAAAGADAATSLDHVSIYVNGAAVATFDGQGNLVSSTAHGDAPVRQDASGSTPVGNTFSASYTLPGVNQLLSMVVVAFDQLGLASESGVANFQSAMTSDQAPLVAISNFAATALVAVGSANTVDVSASDPDATAAAAALNVAGFAPQDSTLDGSLARLAFYVNGALANLIENPPASSSFAFTPPAAGKYVLHSVATDGSGLSTVSDPVVLTAASPTVTVMPAGDGAAVVGGENGKIVVLRTGDTSLPLTVAYKAKGSAVRGVDYKPLPGTVTIPAGAAKAKIKIKIKPLADPALGTRKVKLRLLPASDGSYEVGDPAAAKIRVIDNG